MELQKQLFANRHRTVCGIKAEMSWVGLGVLEKMLQAHREQTGWLVEIGTGCGGTTAYLGAWAKVANVEFVTYDIKARRVADHVADLLDSIGVDRRIADVFSPAIMEEIGGILSLATPGVLFCDGGHKLQEACTFAPMLTPGSVLIVHDVGTELTLDDLSAIECIEVLQPWTDESLRMGTKLAICRRI